LAKNPVIDPEAAPVHLNALVDYESDIEIREMLRKNKEDFTSLTKEGDGCKYSMEYSYIGADPGMYPEWKVLQPEWQWNTGTFSGTAPTDPLDPLMPFAVSKIGLYTGVPVVCNALLVRQKRAKNTPTDGWLSINAVLVALNRAELSATRLAKFGREMGKQLDLRHKTKPV
jgi:hypothetical protein